MIHPKKTVVLHNSKFLPNNKKGNNCLVAEIIEDYLQCDRLAAEDNPCIDDFDTIILVLSNWGDEELPQPMEDYLFNLKITNKRYFVCEIGNYFGLEDYCGCKRVAIQILDNLGWNKISDVSLDSVPNLEQNKLEEWLKTCTF